MAAVQANQFPLQALASLDSVDIFGHPVVPKEYWEPGSAPDEELRGAAPSAEARDDAHSDSRTPQADNEGHSMGRTGRVPQRNSMARLDSRGRLMKQHSKTMVPGGSPAAPVTPRRQIEEQLSATPPATPTRPLQKQRSVAAPASPRTSPTRQASSGISRDRVPIWQQQAPWRQQSLGSPPADGSGASTKPRITPRPSSPRTTALLDRPTARASKGSGMVVAGQHLTAASQSNVGSEMTSVGPAERAGRCLPAPEPGSDIAVIASASIQRPMHVSEDIVPRAAQHDHSTRNGSEILWQGVHGQFCHVSALLAALRIF